VPPPAGESSGAREGECEADRGEMERRGDLSCDMGVLERVRERPRDVLRWRDLEDESDVIVAPKRGAENVRGERS
jgi:hypothetical protein